MPGGQRLLQTSVTRRFEAHEHPIMFPQERGTVDTGTCLWEQHGGDNRQAGEQSFVIRTPSTSSRLPPPSLSYWEPLGPTSSGAAQLAKRRAANREERHRGVLTADSSEGTPARHRGRLNSWMPSSHEAHSPTGSVVTLPGQQLRRVLPLPHTAEERPGPRLMP